MGRLVRVLLAPVACAFGAWGVLASDLGSDAGRHAVAAFVPLVGVLVAVTDRRLRTVRVAAGAMALYGLVCVVFMLLMVTLAEAIAREPSGAFIPIFHYGLGMLLPLLAFVAGTVALAAGRGDPGRR